MMRMSCLVFTAAMVVAGPVCGHAQQQSVRFATALRNVLGEDHVTLGVLDGAGHGGPAFATPANLATVLDFLDRVLARTPRE